MNFRFIYIYILYFSLQQSFRCMIPLQKKVCLILSQSLTYKNIVLKDTVVSYIKYYVQQGARQILYHFVYLYFIFMLIVHNYIA